VLAACKKLPLKVSTAKNPELPGATTTSIKMPWRLILSPNSGAYWRHAASPVSSGSTNHTELWHSQMVTPLFEGGEIVGEIVSPYPDEKRTARASWALSGVGNEIAARDGKLVPMRGEFQGSYGLPAPLTEPFHMPLDKL